MMGVISAAPVDQPEQKLGRAVFDLNADPTRATGVGVNVNVGKGLVHSGEDASGLKIPKTGMASPSFRESTEAMQAGWGELDLERGFGGEGSRIHAGQSLGTGAGTGLSASRIFSSEGSRGTGPPKMRRWGLRATVAMKVFP